MRLGVFLPRSYPFLTFLLLNTPLPTPYKKTIVSSRKRRYGAIFVMYWRGKVKFISIFA